MKKILIFLTIVLLSTTALAKEINPWEQKLPFKEAIISYEITGTQTGSSTLYLKDYGKTSALFRNVTTKILMMKTQESTLNITTRDWVYSIDLNEKTGMKQVNPEKYLIEEFNKLSAAEQKKVAANVEEFGMSFVTGMEGTFEKNAKKILGYNCDKITMMGTTVYSISNIGLPLKTKSNMMGMKFKEKATEIKKTSVPADKFMVPDGVKIRYIPDNDEIARNHAKMVIQSMLEDKQPTPQMEDSQPPEQTEDPEKAPAGMEEQMKSLMKMFGGSSD